MTLHIKVLKNQLLFILLLKVAKFINDMSKNVYYSNPIRNLQCVKLKVWTLVTAPRCLHESDS